MLEDVFDNNYYFLPVYSPHLNPIEPCFALVKEWIRHHEEEALADPVHYINMAFNRYSVGGIQAGSVVALPPTELRLLCRLAFGKRSTL